MVMKIVPTRHLEWPPPYKAATERYSPQLRLDGDGDLKNYVAGLPFPLLDVNDPQAATKIMWNFAYRHLQADDPRCATSLAVHSGSSACAALCGAGASCTRRSSAIGMSARFHQRSRTPFAVLAYAVPGLKTKQTPQFICSAGTQYR